MNPNHTFDSFSAAGTDSIPHLKLNMQMLVDKFSNRDFDPVFYNSQYDKMKLENVMFFYGQDNLEERIVYLCSEETLMSHPPANHDICFIIYGNVPKEMDHLQNPLIFFTEVDPAILLNTANEIFQIYQKFVLDLFDVLYTGGLSAISIVGLRFFKNPLQIHDENMVLLSRPQTVSGMVEVKYDPQTGIASFHPDIINAMRHNPKYIKTLSTRGSHFWFNKGHTSHRVLYINLFDKSNNYRGRLMLNELKSIIQPSHFQTLEYFSRFVLAAITQPNSNAKETYLSFGSFLQKYLHGDFPSKETVLKALELNKWQNNDSYVCAKIRLPNNNNAMNSNAILTTSLLFLFSGCSTFMDDEYVWLVENLNENHISFEMFENKLKTFSRNGSYYTGCSAQFDDFFSLPNAFRQADIALKSGLMKNPLEYYHSFADNIHDFLISKLCEAEEPETLCHEKLFFLLKYDMQKGTDYYTTLRIYLENERNLTVVSHILHIHRSTLQYRIEKIDELIQLPLDDPQFRYYLLSCFYIMDHHHLTPTNTY